MPFETTQPNLSRLQQDLLNWGWRIDQVVKNRGNSRTVWARCLGL